MTDDQHTIQDPTTQHPDSLPADQLEHPGLESEMSQAPDFGEATYRGSGRLEGRKAVITGGDSGIGRAVALAFAREGADVAISYLEDEQSDADETARVVRDAGRTALQLPGDLQDEDHCRSLVDRTARGARRRRHPRQQRRLPDGARRPRRHLHRRAGAHVPHQHPGHVPHLPGRARAHAAGRDDHQHHLHPGLPARPHAARLRRHQGRDRQLHQGAGAGDDRARHPRQRRRSRPDLDAAHPRHDAAGQGRGLRRRGVARPSAPASRPSSPPSTCSSPPRSRATSMAR